MERTDIDEKVLRGEELTSEEICFIFWNYDSIAEKNGEHHRWWYTVYKIFQVGERYFQVWGAIGLTEYQEDEFDCSEVYEVVKKEKIIFEWVMKEDETND